MYRYSSLSAILFATILSSTNGIASDLSMFGKVVFDRKCSGCHEVGPGATNGIGPSLNDLFGRKAGTAPNFKFYSNANLKADFIWADVSFKKFIRDPKSMIAATKQLFNGLKDQKEIDGVAEYLKEFSRP